MRRLTSLLLITLIVLPLPALGQSSLVTLHSDPLLDGWILGSAGCYASEINLVSDLRTGISGYDYWNAYISFDISGIPAGGIQGAVLWLYQSNVVNTPYTNGSRVVVDLFEHGVSLEMADHCVTASSSELGVLSSNADLGWKSVDVTTALNYVLALDHDLLQFRLRFLYLPYSNAYAEFRSGDAFPSGFAPRLDVTVADPPVTDKPIATNTADLNGDGAVNAADLVLLSNFIAGNVGSLFLSSLAIQPDSLNMVSGSLKLFGALKNHGTVDVIFPQVQIDYLDDTGTIIESGVAFAQSNSRIFSGTQTQSDSVIRGGETGYFSDSSSINLAVVDSVNLRIEYDYRDTTAPAAGLIIDSITLASSGPGSSHYSGVLRNNGAVPADFSSILLVSFDTTGKILDISMDFADAGGGSSTIPVGGTGTFSEVVPVDRTAIAAYDTRLDWRDGAVAVSAPSAVEAVTFESSEPRESYTIRVPLRSLLESQDEAGEE